MSGGTPSSDRRDAEAGGDESAADGARPEAGQAAAGDGTPNNEPAHASGDQPTNSPEETPNNAGATQQAGNHKTSEAQDPGAAEVPPDSSGEQSNDHAAPPTPDPPATARNLTANPPTSPNDAPAAPADAATEAKPPHLSRYQHIVALAAVPLALAAIGISVWSELRPDPPQPAQPQLPTINDSIGQPNAALSDRCADTPNNRAGWGPDRPMVAGQTVLPWPGFNADRSNPNIGDERNMVAARPADSDELWSNDIRVEHGKQYTVRMYVHNSAADLDDTVATDTTAWFTLPDCKGKRVSLNGFLRSPAAFPIEVWGGVNFTASRAFRITYVTGSARLETNGLPGGKRIDGTAFLQEPGQPIGYSALDGAVRGGYQHAMYFSLELEVSMD